MITVECTSNNIEDVGSDDLKEFAFTQDPHGVLDVTRGGMYVVYGIRENKLGKFYLILTDTIHTSVPWWMPASLFRVANNALPASWGKYKWHGDYGGEVIQADPIYFDAQEDVEDGTLRGQQIFDVMRKRLES